MSLVFLHSWAEVLLGRSVLHHQVLRSILGVVRNHQNDGASSNNRYVLHMGLYHSVRIRKVRKMLELSV